MSHLQSCVDSIKVGLGGMLLQKQSDGNLKVISYFSRTTTKAELETLAVVKSIRRFRVYLIGVH